MVTDKKYNWPSFLSLVIILQFSCHPNCYLGKYNLVKGSALFYPQTDSLHVGDTLWMNIKIPITLKSAVDSSLVNISGASGMATDVLVTILAKPNTSIGALDSFSRVSQTGSFAINNSAPDASLVIQFTEQAGSFVFTLGWIPLKSGIYAIIPHDIFRGEKKCFTASIQIQVENADQHLHYLRDIYYDGNPIALIDSLHNYCFKVY